jgi:hypothetical protein
MLAAILVVSTILPSTQADASSYARILYKWLDCLDYSRASSTSVYVPDSPTNEINISWAVSSTNFNGIKGVYCYQSNFYKLVFQFRDYSKTTQWATLSFFMSIGSSQRYYKVCSIFGCFPVDIEGGDNLQACTMEYYWAFGWGIWHTDWQCQSWFQG